MDAFDFVNRANADYVDDLYKQYQKDPRNVEPHWQAYFAGFDMGAAKAAGVTPGGAAAVARAAGTTANAVSVPAHAWTARCAKPSPPSVISVPAPASTARAAIRALPAAEWATKVSSRSTPVRRVAATVPATCAAEGCTSNAANVLTRHHQVASS